MFARMPWFSIHWHVFDSDAVDKPLRPLANRFCGCSVWALAPFFVVFGALLFASLFPLAKRKSGWGICGSSCLVVFCGFCVVLFDLPAQNGHIMSLYKRLSDSLCSCKDRAFSATSAKLEEKKMVAGSVTLIQECERFPLHRDQVYHQSVQPRFWTGNLCQLC